MSRLGAELTPVIGAIPTVSAPPEFGLAKAMLMQWQTNGWDCPSGVVGTDPKGPAETTQVVVQNSSACFLFHVFLHLSASRSKQALHYCLAFQSLAPHAFEDTLL